MNKINQKEKFFVVVIAIIIFLIAYAFFQNRSKDYNYLKVDKSQYLVYTISQTQSGSYYQYKPYLNIKEDIGTYINYDINSYFQNFKDDNICITYESDLNGKVLSLIIKVEDHSYAESATVLYFRSYNINLSTLKLVDNDTLFGYYGITESQVSNTLNGRIGEYYNQLVNEGVVDSRTCNYNCFLESRGFQEGLQDVSYYVRDGKLIAFKPYTFLSVDSHEETVIHDFEIAS